MLISKLFETETSHIVREAVSERCKNNIHGHSYLWKVFIETSACQSNGMVLDFKELKPVKDFIDLFDHTTVFWAKEDTKIINFFKDNFDRILIMQKNPTAENMARLVCKFTNDWLLSIPNANYQVYTCTRVEVNETRTGCGISSGDYDVEDILTYTYSNLY